MLSHRLCPFLRGREKNSCKDGKGMYCFLCPSENDLGWYKRPRADGVPTVLPYIEYLPNSLYSVQSCDYPNQPPSSCGTIFFWKVFWGQWYPCCGFLVTFPLCLKAHMHVQRWNLAWIWTGNHLDRRRTWYYCASGLACYTTCLKDILSN